MYGVGAVCPIRWVREKFPRLLARHRLLGLCVRGGRGRRLLFIVVLERRRERGDIREMSTMTCDGVYVSFVLLHFEKET